MTHSRWIYFFGNGGAEGGNEIKHLVGGKGASLGEMTRAGLNVPPGFTLSTEACRLYYQRERDFPEGLLDDVRTALSRLEALAGRTFGRGDRPLLVAVRSGAVQSMPGMMDTILNVGLNPDCVRAMAQRSDNPRTAWNDYFQFLAMYAKTVYGETHRLDERALDELIAQDLREEKANNLDELNAGQMERLCRRMLGYLRNATGKDFPVEPWDMLVGAIEAVFRSWNSERALTYRRHHHIDGLLGTAVNVQMMCPSQISGVMFTTNPVQAGRDEIIIESAHGLGEAIVLGRVTPDRFVLDRDPLRIREKQAAPRRENERSQRNEAELSLNDEQVIQLARLGLKVEGYFDVACDIEWGWADDQFYLLQARPIRHKNALIDPTEREKARTDEIDALRRMADPRGTVWARFNLSEILPEPTPMTWAIVRRFMSGAGGFGQMYRDLGFDPDPALDDIGMFDLVCGRPYCNLTREPRMQYRSMPFEHSFERLKANPALAIYPQATPNFQRAGWTFWLTLPVTMIRMLWSGFKLKRMERTFARRFVEEIVPAYLAEVKRAEKEDIQHLTSTVLLERIETWIRKSLFEFGRESLKPTALASIAMANLERTLAQRLTRFSADPQKQKENEAKGMERARTFVRQLVMGVHPDRKSDLPAALRDLAMGKLSREQFLEDFGHRGSGEMELSRPRWREQGESLDRTMGAVTGSDEPPDLEPVWEALTLEAHLMPFQRKVLDEEVHVLHSYLRLRETAKHYLIRGYTLIRRYLVELDRRHELRGGIFYLLPEELPRLIALTMEDENGKREFQSLIAQRRKQRDIALSLPVPQVIFSDDLEAIGRLEEIAASASMQGVPLSAGVAEGSAWVLHEVEEGAPPSDDYILVCPTTDPAWVPLFVNARGLVMETGGVLSHGAIVAREFGLPAVAGISDVHRRLKTGQRLRVDGGTGKVSVLD